MKYFRRGHVLSLASALTLVAGAGKADTMFGNAATAGTPANLFNVGAKVTGLGSPTSFAFLPDGRMVITDKGGDLLIADTSGATKTAGTFPVDTESEKGLLNVLVHPNFASNRLLIFYYSRSNTASPPVGDDINRHRVVTVPLGTNDMLDMSQETILVQGLRGPANHDGGALAIGPDGKLYIGVGDTGCNSNRAPEPVYTPTNFFATCLSHANGKILRVNLDGTIPNDNPLVNVAQVTRCDNICSTDVTTLAPATGTEIRTDVWAWGFRNPWRISFDNKTGNLWVGDVGEVTYEEINIIPPSGKGKHYGWPWREGSHGHPANACQQILPNAGDCVDPQYYCSHGGQGGVDANCAAIMGGTIVDSCDWPASFQGRYFFGDHPRKWIASVALTPNRNGLASTTRAQFITTTGNPTHFAVGPDGALYYATLTPGTIQRVSPKTPVSCPAPDAGGGSGGAAGASGAGGGAGTAGTVGGGGTAGAAGANPGNGGTGQAGGANGGGTPGNAGTANAGTGNAGRGNAGQGGLGTAGGTVGGAAPIDASIGSGAAGDDSSCGCRVVSDTRRDHLALWSLALGAGVLGRRRRRA